MSSNNERPFGRPQYFSKGWQRPAKFSILMVLGLILAILLASDYGQAWDDEFDADTGRTALDAYFGGDGYLTTRDQRFYGPFFFMISEISVRLARSINPAWHPVDIRHVANFTSFLLALPALFLLARMFFSKRLSMFLVLLFSSQPLLFGHAFINQKDIPFMTATLWAFISGIRAFNQLDTEPEQRAGSKTSSLPSFLPSIINAWKSLAVYRKLLILISVLIASLTILDLILGLIVLPGVKTLIAEMYTGTTWQPLQLLFGRIAEDSNKTPLSLYLEKTERIYLWLRVPFGIAILAIASMIAKKQLYSTKVMRAPFWSNFPSFVGAGIILGITISLRAPGSFIGILVMLYVVLKFKRGGILPLVIYALITILALYLVWPFLWESPVANYIESLHTLSNFPPHKVLYRGELLASNNLPWHYLPTLIALQLTEPVQILAVLGFVIFLNNIRQRHCRDLKILVLAWFFLPVAFIILNKTPIYGNFRQLLFLLPPAFILAGFSISAINARLTAGWMSPTLALAILLPGIWGIIRLHPYEYTYFNQYTGGTKGAYNMYDLDYWCTSYREAAEYLDDTAAPGSVVVVAGPEYGVRNFIREDIQVRPDWQGIEQPDYTVACDTALFSGFYGDIPTVYTIQRDGAIFGRVQGRE